MTGQLPTFHARRHQISVATATSPQGQVNPIRFIWRSRAYTIASWRRRWQAADGDHFLVMTAAGRMFELVHRVQDGEWFLLGAAPRHATV